MPRRPANRVPSNAAALTEGAQPPPRKTKAYYAQLTEKYGRNNDITLDPDLPPWEHQEGETIKQYAYFRAYLEMPPAARSLQQLSVIVDKQPAYLSVLNTSKKWGERVLAWDIDQRRLYELKLEKRREELIDQHLRVSDGLFRLVLAKVGAMQPDDLASRDMPGLVAAAGDLARKALGMDNPKGTNVNVLAAAQSSSKANAEAKTGGEVEARQMFEQVLASMDNMVDGMTEEQRREALESWGAMALPAGVVEGEATQ